nr:leucine-rich repeat extensin-like protein 3 [Lolium perenne]
MAEGRKLNFPSAMTDDEIERLGVLVSRVDRPVQPPLPRYATDIMPPCLTEEEAQQRALQNSARHAPPPPPPLFSPWAAPPPPPAFIPWVVPPPAPPPAAPPYFPPVANWLWQMPEFVVLDDDNDEE